MISHEFLIVSCKRQRQQQLRSIVRVNMGEKTHNLRMRAKICFKYLITTYHERKFVIFNGHFAKKKQQTLFSEW